MPRRATLPVLLALLLAAGAAAQAQSSSGDGTSPAEDEGPAPTSPHDYEALFVLALIVPGAAMLLALIGYIVHTGGTWGEDARRAAEGRAGHRSARPRARRGSHEKA